MRLSVAIGLLGLQAASAGFTSSSLPRPPSTSLKGRSPGFSGFSDMDYQAQAQAAWLKKTQGGAEAAASDPSAKFPTVTPPTTTTPPAPAMTSTAPPANINENPQIDVEDLQKQHLEMRLQQEKERAQLGQEQELQQRRELDLEKERLKLQQEQLAQLKKEQELQHRRAQELEDERRKIQEQQAELYQQEQELIERQAQEAELLRRQQEEQEMEQQRALEEEAHRQYQEQLMQEKLERRAANQARREQAKIHQAQEFHHTMQDRILHEDDQIRQQSKSAFGTMHANDEFMTQSNAAPKTSFVRYSKPLEEVKRPEKKFERYMPEKEIAQPQKRYERYTPETNDKANKFRYEEQATGRGVGRYAPRSDIVKYERYVSPPKPQEEWHESPYGLQKRNSVPQRQPLLLEEADNKFTYQEQATGRGVGRYARPSTDTSDVVNYERYVPDNTVPEPTTGYGMEEKAAPAVERYVAPDPKDSWHEGPYGMHGGSGIPPKAKVERYVPQPSAPKPSIEDQYKRYEKPPPADHSANLEQYERYVKPRDTQPQSVQEHYRRLHEDFTTHYQKRDDFQHGTGGSYFTPGCYGGI